MEQSASPSSPSWASSASEAPSLGGRAAYAAQQPWIMNATLRENVLFGRDFDETKY